MTRKAKTPQPFELQPKERAALCAAQKRFLEWRTGPVAVPALRQALLTSFREGVTRTLAALDGLGDRERATLIGLMKNAVHVPTADDEHRKALEELRSTLDLLARATGPFAAKPGNVASEDSRLWVCFAAEEWDRAGLKVNRGRFAKALEGFRGEHPIPAVGSSQVREGIAEWQRISGGNLGINTATT